MGPRGGKEMEKNGSLGKAGPRERSGLDWNWAGEKEKGASWRNSLPLFNKTKTEKEKAWKNSYEDPKII